MLNLNFLSFFFSWTSFSKLFLGFIFFIQGCTFIGAGFTGDATYTKSQQPDAIYNYMPKKDLSIIQREGWQDKGFTTIDIEVEWGKPDEILINSDGSQVWKYKMGLRWKGVNLMIILPVRLPIAIPVGYKTITFAFISERLVQWTIIDDHWCITYVGFNFIPLDPEGKTLGFHYETACEMHKDMHPYNGKMNCYVPFYNSCYPKGHPGL